MLPKFCPPMLGALTASAGDRKSENTAPPLQLRLQSCAGAGQSACEGHAWRTCRSQQPPHSHPRPRKKHLQRPHRTYSATRDDETRMPPGAAGRSEPEEDAGVDGVTLARAQRQMPLVHAAGNIASLPAGKIRAMSMERMFASFLLLHAISSQRQPPVRGYDAQRGRRHSQRVQRRLVHALQHARRRLDTVHRLALAQVPHGDAGMVGLGDDLTHAFVTFCYGGGGISNYQGQQLTKLGWPWPGSMYLRRMLQLNTEGRP
jgi:hypothetical protein